MKTTKKLYKISDIKKTLGDMGIHYSLDNIRKLEKTNILSLTRLQSKHRVFNQEQFNKSARNVAYYFMGASIQEILANGEVLKARGRKIIKTARFLLK